MNLARAIKYRWKNVKNEVKLVRLDGVKIRNLLSGIFF